MKLSPWKSNYILILHRTGGIINYYHNILMDVYYYIFIYNRGRLSSYKRVTSSRLSFPETK